MRANHRAYAHTHTHKLVVRAVATSHIAPGADAAVLWQGYILTHARVHERMTPKVATAAAAGRGWVVNTGSRGNKMCVCVGEVGNKLARVNIDRRSVQGIIVQ